MSNNATRSRSRSKQLVVAIMLVAIALTVGARWYLVSGDDHTALADLDCDQLLPTIGEVQGTRIELNRDSVCAVLDDIARSTPTSNAFANDEEDPWHYVARIRVQTPDNPWFLVFVARASTDFHPELSLRQRREGGWAIVGEFDGERVLKRLGLLDRIDRVKLASPASRAPIDQRQPL